MLRTEVAEHTDLRVHSTSLLPSESSWTLLPFLGSVFAVAIKLLKRFDF